MRGKENDHTAKKDQPHAEKEWKIVLNDKGKGGNTSYNPNKHCQLLLQLLLC